MLETRDLHWERALTEAAAEGMGLDPERLIAFAEERAAAGAASYGDVGFLDRDLPQEALDEIADTRNYEVWLAQKIALRGDDLDEGTEGEIFSLLTAASSATVQLFSTFHEIKRLCDEAGL